MHTWDLTPLNEGQEMNFVKYTGKLSKAKVRAMAETMRDALQKALPGAQIEVRVTATERKQTEPDFETFTV